MATTYLQQKYSVEEIGIAISEQNGNKYSMEKEASTEADKQIIITPKSSHSKNVFRKLRIYFFQFFMLFLAITAGFFAENLREEMGERRQSREYATAIVDDLARDTLNIRYHISRLEVAINTIAELADYVRDKQVKDINNLELYRLTSITWNPPFRWSRATLEQIKSSGSLRFFTNDSIVYYISQYDAWTLHLDQDNLEDQVRYLQAVERRGHVVDMNYPEEFLRSFKTNPDSIRNTPAFIGLNSSKELLTKDISEVKLMVNNYLMVKDYCVGRVKELSSLAHDQSRLVFLLKREYSFSKDD